MSPQASQIVRSPLEGSYRAPLALLFALLFGVWLPGCGGSGAHHTRAATNPADKLSPIPIVHETRADVVAAVAACRAGVDKAHWLSQGSKEDLHRTCDYGLRRGLTEIKRYGQEACKEVVYTSPAKSAAEKARIFATCYAGTKLRTTVAGQQPGARQP
jgi:hypothetical protein